MAPTLEPEVVDGIPAKKPAKKRRPQIRFKIRNLPLEARRELHRRFNEQDFRSFKEVSLWLEEDYGSEISPESLHNYYRINFDPILNAVKLATAQAHEILRANGGEDDLTMNGALLRLVQTAIYDLLVQIYKAHDLVERIPAANKQGRRQRSAVARKRIAAGQAPDAPNAQAATPEAKFPNRVELAAVNALGRTTVVVGRAVIGLQRWREEMRDKLNEKIADATEKISEAARAEGMSPQTEETIRSLLMEIKV